MVRSPQPSIRAFNNQKTNDADAVSVFSQAIDQVRSGVLSPTNNPLLKKKKSVIIK